MSKISEGPRRILNVVGTRPNLVKIAPIMEAMSDSPALEPRLVHTGQHYDENLSKVFFQELAIPEPDVYLGVGSGSHAEQTGQIMMALEAVYAAEAPDAVLVVGDVNSTVAAALTASKMGIPVIHLEAGLRSYDRDMPEEINRVVTDSISDLCLTSCADSEANLVREGVPRERIRFVGNVMIDTLMSHRERAAGLDMPARYGLAEGEYGLMTLHRPSNVDVPEVLKGIVGALLEIQEALPLLFAMHPRTRQRLQTFGLWARLIKVSQVVVTEPLGYLEFLNLMSSARIVLTDSGGIQEETTALGVPCLTLRNNTERPVTITKGTNRLVGNDPARIVAAVKTSLANRLQMNDRPRFWDGSAAPRVTTAVSDFLFSQACQRSPSS